MTILFIIFLFDVIDEEEMKDELKYYRDILEEERKKQQQDKIKK